MIRAAIFFLIIWDALKVYLGLHEPFVQFLLLGPFLGLGFLNAFAGAGSNILLSRPIGIWLIWIAYALFNTFLVVGFDPHRDTSAAVFVSSILLGPIFAGLLAAERISTESALNTVIGALALRMVLSFIFDDLGQLGVDEFARLGVEFNSNAIAGGAFFLLVVLTIRRRHFKKYWFDSGLALQAIALLLLTASVKFFIATVLFFLCVLLLDLKRRSAAGKVKKSVLVAWLTLVVGIAVLPQTSVVGRTLDKFDRSMSAETSTQLFDNRAAQYILGWEEFRESPVNGIGLRNFMNRSGNTAPLHSEYLVQLVENGLIGTAIFIAFWWAVIAGLFQALRNQALREIGLLYISAIGVLLYLYLGIWSYNIPFNWILIGLAIRHVLLAKRQQRTANRQWSAPNRAGQS